MISPAAHLGKPPITLKRLQALQCHASPLSKLPSHKTQRYQIRQITGGMLLTSLHYLYIYHFQ
jgi:hypothetical protein